MLLIACCCMLGYIKAFSYKARCIELEKIIEMMKLLEMEITYRKDPLSKSFKKLSSTRQCWFSEVLNCCSSELEKHNSLADSWKTSIDTYRGKSPIKKKDIDILDDFVIGLGKTDSEGQRKLFEPASIRLNSCLKEAVMNEQRLGKMYIALGTAAGTIAVILLI